MRVLLIYKKHQGALGKHYEMGFKRLGFDVETFNLSDAPRWIIRGNARIILRPLSNINICDLINSLKEKPDLVFEIDGGDRHLKGWDRIDIPKIFYAVDSHLVYGFHRNILNDFDYVFCAQKDFVAGFKEVKEEIFWLPLAAEPTIHTKLELPKLFDIGFVGSLDTKMHPERVKLLWKFREKYSVLAVEGVYEENVSKIYSLSKIGFNKSIRSDLNMRTFEIMSCGTLLITDKIDNGLYDLFKDKNHLVTYNDMKEADELIQYYVDNNEERENIAAKGQEEVWAKHTYDKRLNYILKMVKIINDEYSNTF